METKKGSLANLVLMIKPFNSKMLLFIFLALMAISVFAFSEWPHITSNDAAHQRLPGMKWLLPPHILCGFTGLVLGPFQFSSRIRRRNIGLHRAMGKIYVFVVLLASVLGLLVCLIYRPPGASFKFTFENIVQASVWFITTLVAWMAARNRQIPLHKIWMSRSYGLTFVLVTSQVLNRFLFIARMDIDTFSIYLWFCVVVALLIPEILLNWRQLFLSHKKTSYKNE